MELTNIVIFGAPGSGKGTQSELIIKKYGLDHISTGDVLRAEINNKTKLGKIANGYISEGKLVPDELITKMLTDAFDNKRSLKGVIFDGFPRTILQGISLDEMLKIRGMKLQAVLSLEVDDAELTDRLVKRGQSSGRPDDNLDTITARLAVYHEQTSPLKKYYAQQGKLVPIKGVGSIEEIFERIESALQ